MENKNSIFVNQGGIKMAINDTVEIISKSNEEIYGKIGRIVEIKEDKFGTDIRIQTRDGLDIWIDAQDVVIY